MYSFHNYILKLVQPLFYRYVFQLLCVAFKWVTKPGSRNKLCSSFRQGLGRYLLSRVDGVGQCDLGSQVGKW
jgi:hypothetical protein